MSSHPILEAAGAECVNGVWRVSVEQLDAVDETARPGFERRPGKNPSLLIGRFESLEEGAPPAFTFLWRGRPSIKCFIM